MIPLNVTESIFIADVHLGKLARLLRLFGFDTKYENYYTNSDLLKIAFEENRILLSRNAAFKENKHLNFLHVLNENPKQQVKQVVENLNLRGKFHPFTRCIVCNGSLEVATKESVLIQLRKPLLYFIMNSGNAIIANEFTGKVHIITRCFI